MNIFYIGMQLVAVVVLLTILFEVATIISLIVVMIAQHGIDTIDLVSAITVIL
jgi:hypothetical protein